MVPLLWYPMNPKKCPTGRVVSIKPLLENGLYKQSLSGLKFLYSLVIVKSYIDPDARGAE